jgi:hypothetical protein
MTLITAQILVSIRIAQAEIQNYYKLTQILLAKLIRHFWKHNLFTEWALFAICYSREQGLMKKILSQK